MYIYVYDMQLYMIIYKMCKCGFLCFPVAYDHEPVPVGHTSRGHQGDGFWADGQEFPWEKGVIFHQE